MAGKRIIVEHIAKRRCISFNGWSPYLEYEGALIGIVRLYGKVAPSGAGRQGEEVYVKRNLFTWRKLFGKLSQEEKLLTGNSRLEQNEFARSGVDNVDGTNRASIDLNGVKEYLVARQEWPLHSHVDLSCRYRIPQRQAVAVVRHKIHLVV